jgi:hypothetical protein
MEFYNQSWFWTGLFTLLGSLGGIISKELISNRFVTRLEWQKRYESDLFKAYNSLYQFATFARRFIWPPEDIARDYRALLDSSYFKEVKDNMIFFNSETRRILARFTNQSMPGDDEFDPDAFEKFYKNELPISLRRLQEIVEKRFDLILHEND